MESSKLNSQNKFDSAQLRLMMQFAQIACEVDPCLAFALAEALAAALANEAPAAPFAAGPATGIAPAEAPTVPSVPPGRRRVGLERNHS